MNSHSASLLLAAAAICGWGTERVYSQEKAGTDVLPVMHKDTDPKANKPVEVVFVLDTTGSMGGLIGGAKKKIWSMAHAIVSMNQSADIKFGLIGYRDRGDEYITKVFDLTADMDMIYGELEKFTAEGGGDTPESVNQAIYEALTAISWSSAERDVYRSVFLVGDCEAHMDYQDDVKYVDSCRRAREHGIIINAIQCGDSPDAERQWREIAALADGSYAQIQQTGGMVVIETPYDEEIKVVTAELVATAIPFGHVAAQNVFMERQRVLGNMDAVANADRTAFMRASRGRSLATLRADVSKGPASAAMKDVAESAAEALELAAILNSPVSEISGTSDKAVSDMSRVMSPATYASAEAVYAGDLNTLYSFAVGLEGEERVKREEEIGEQLANEEFLPEPMKKMTLAERKAYVVSQVVKRKAVNVRMEELNANRLEWLDAEYKRRVASGEGRDAFDATATAMIYSQVMRTK